MSVAYEIIVQGNNLSFRDGYFALANISLIHAPDGPMLFDTGHHSNRPALLKALRERGMEPGDIRRVFLSHLHFDHCNNIDLFTEAEVFASRADWNYVENPHPEDMFVPWMIREQLSKHKLELLEGEGSFANHIRYFPAPGHTPGCYALDLDTEKGRVVIAGDAIKYAKEAVTARCDMAFDTVETGTATIRKILGMADRIVPGHFPELIVEADGRVTWTDRAELPIIIR